MKKKGQKLTKLRKPAQITNICPLSKIVMMSKSAIDICDGEQIRRANVSVDRIVVQQ